MKKASLVVAISAAMAMAGCDNNQHYDQQAMIDRDIDSMASKQAISEFNTEKKEVAQFLKTVQEKDPAVKDAYYGVDEKTGEKVLYVEREEDNGNVMMAGFPGFVAGYALASTFGSGPGYYRANASSISSMTAGKASRWKNSARAQNLQSIKSTHISSIRSNPARMSSIKTGVMSRMSSARSAGYSSGS